MEKKKNVQIFVIAALSFAILFMSVGFATYASQLTINGTTTVRANKWSVHYVDSSYAETTGSKVATKTITNTDFTFSVTLEEPGDFYEASLNVINDGTFDATLNSITLSTLTAAEAKFLKYTVTYDGTAYDATRTGLNSSLPFATGSNTKAVKVRVEYIQPESSADLPQENVDVTLTASLDYAQAA